MSDAHVKMALKIGRLTADKNRAYGDSFGRAGDILRILYPNGVNPEEYDEMLSVARIIDKLFRLATRKDAFGESPYRDIAGYALLGAVRHERSGEGEGVDVEGVAQAHAGRVQARSLSVG